MKRSATLAAPVAAVAAQVVALFAALAASMPAAAQSQAELAKQLANPIASLISVPFQSSWDHNIGADEAGRRYTLNVQPVIPISLNADWNLISRTIVPIVDQSNIAPGSGSQTGFGDTVQSLFFSPKNPTAGGWIWGAGPVFLIPTGSNDLLTADKWGLGPTGVALKQEGPLTYGVLANHIWSVAGSSQRADVNSTFLQPFFTYATPTAWSLTLTAEATRDWERRDTSIPIGAFLGKVTRIGNQLVQLGAGPRYYASSFDNGPKGWGFRFVVVLLFPK